MSDPNTDFAAARQLEEIKLSQDISDAAVQREADLKAKERSLAAQGLAQSGPRFVAEIDIMFDSTQRVIDKAISRRKELGGTVPELLTAANLGTLEKKLNELADAALNGVRTRLTLNPRNAAGGAVLTKAERRAYAMKARVRNSLAALPLEAKLGMHEKREVRPVINISHSTIANLNLGTVIGDLNSSIQQLTAAGQKDLSEALRKLTEAIVASTEVGDSAKKGLLEHVAFISGEMALPAEKRKMGPVRSSIEALKTGVLIASQLVTLWQGVEKALQIMGALPPSS